MTMPSSTQDQILLKLGEIGVDVAVIKKTLEDIPDHESRIRSLEKWRYGLPLSAFFSAASLAIGAYGWLGRH